MMVFNWKQIRKHILKTFHIYSQSSTFHCVRYIGATNLNLFERIFWLIAFISFFIWACTAGNVLWGKFDEKPTIVKIEDTNLAFTEVIFPAVTICPANRIKKSLAETYLSRYLNSTIKNREFIMTHVSSALSLLQYPTYYFVEFHLRQVDKYLTLFNTLNITDFMIKTLPDCSEIMEECYWLGKQRNCCEIFSLQRTEEGFCYSFNSMRSETMHDCPAYVSPIMMLQDKKVEINDPRCTPMFTTASGMFSGLTVIMKEDVSKDRMGENGTKYEKGVVVLISTTHELPEAGTGKLLETFPGEMLQLEVIPLVMGSSRKLANVAQEERGCRLLNEEPLWMYDLYTQSSCLTECRVKYIGKKCKCHLYFFHDKTRSYPPCTVNQLKCLMRLKSTLNTKDFSAPSLGLPGCKCTLPCYGLIYDLLTRRMNVSTFCGKQVNGILDVHFSSRGGIKYLKKLSFTDTQLTVSIGSVGNLFLGCSIISILEFIFYFIRALVICNMYN